MLGITINNAHKSIKAPSSCELPDFCILIGKNGSGKSHFLETLSLAGLANVNKNGNHVRGISYLPFGSLHPNVNETSIFQNLLKKQKEAWNKINSNLKNVHNSITQNPSTTIEQVAQGLYRDKNITRFIIELDEISNHDISSVTEDMFNSVYQLPDNILSTELAEIFKLYHRRLDDNAYKEFQNEKYDLRKRVLNEKQFESRYGPKPWELINQIFKNAHLPFEVNNPENQGRDDDFFLKLINVNNGIEIQFNDLSTGEKVLAYLAISVYNTKSKGARPDVILFDEPDAALHPEFSKVLIDTIRDVIVKEAGVSVIMTTHSPTTVAVANEEDLYEMSKSESKPIKISKQRAITLLTKDLDNIRLTTDNRRQVFVESKYDVEYFEKICRWINPQPLKNLHFLAPHNKNGSNCDDVMKITKQLVDLGNDLVYGIIDYDKKNTAENRILVLGEKSRYAIENYIFDPIFVGFLLIREGIIDKSHIGDYFVKFTELKGASDEQIQGIADYVLSELELNKEEKINCKVVSGKEYLVNNDYLMSQGHELESKILNKWPGLNVVKRGKTEENILKNYILDKVIFEFPDFLSADFVELFEKIE